MSIPLWDIETSWFQQVDSEYKEHTYMYENWNDFLSCRPYKMWKPYSLTSWAWKKVSDIPIPLRHQSYEPLDSIQMDTRSKLQIVFMTSGRFSKITRVEFFITEEDEPAVRDWLKKHMPNFWKI